MASDDDGKKRLEYRKALLKISDRLSTDNLQGLKVLLRDVVGQAKLDAARQGTDIFEVLDEKGKIKADDLGYLRELLDAIERQDLCEMIKVYEEGGMTKQSAKIYTDQDLKPVLLGEIAKDIGREWKMLARHLGLSEPDIQAIHQANMFDLHEASLQSLLRWQDKFGDKATTQVLKRALLDMKLRGVVQTYFDPR